MSFRNILKTSYDALAEQQQTHSSEKKHYELCCNQIYNDICRMMATDIELEHWTKQTDDVHHISTWVYNGPHEKYGVLGTNGEIVVQQFNANSYNHIKTDDFAARGNLLFEAFHHLISKYRSEQHLFKLGEHRQQMLNETIKVLKAKQDFLKAAIHNQCHLDVKMMRNIDDERVRAKYFEHQYQKAEQLLQNSLLDIANLLQALEPLYTLESAIKKIEAAEKELIAERGRPVIMKIGPIVEENNSAMMMSAQFPQGLKTLPSSLRDGRRDIKLSNHVMDVTGHLNDKNKIEVDIIIDGHSSYPPIKEKDELLRRYVAFKAVQEKIAATAKTMHLANSQLGTHDNPIRIPLSSMLLLSPTRSPFLEAKLRGLDSEHGQLADSKYALEMLKHAKSPVKVVTTDGKELFCAIDMTYMNLPVNANRLKQLFMRNPLQVGINARGFHEYCENMRHALNTENEQVKALLRTSPSTISEHTNQLMNHYSQQTHTAITQYGHYLFAEQEQFKTHPKKKKLDLLNNMIIANDALLPEKYQALAIHLEAYVNETNATKRDNHKQQYKNIKKEIQEIEKKSFALYQNANHLRKDIYLNSIDMRSKIQNSLNALLNANDISPELREHCQTHQRTLRLQEMFYTKQYKNPKYAYQFHILYLLTNEKIGREIEAFCKSAEDRTGWLRVSLLATLAFNQVYGRDPDWQDKADREKYDRYYSLTAHELSASLENTKYNSQAKGLQVNPKFTNPYLGMMGKILAGSAKKLFKIKDIEQKSADAKRIR